MRTLLIVALAAAPAAAAKPKAGKPPTAAAAKAEAAGMAAHLERALDLTPEQTEKVSGILAESVPTIHALRQKLAEQQRKTDESIRAVLNDEQKERFDAMRARREHEEPGRAAAPAPRPRRRPEPLPPEHDGAHDDPAADRPGVMIDTGDEPPSNPPPPRRKKR